MPDKYKLYLIGLKYGADTSLIDKYLEEKLNISDQIARKNILYSTPYVLFETERLENATAAAFELEKLGAHVEIKKMPNAGFSIPNPGLTPSSVKLQIKRQEKPFLSIFLMIAIVFTLGGFLLFKVLFYSPANNAAVVHKVGAVSDDTGDEPPATVRINDLENMENFDQAVTLSAALNEILDLVKNKELDLAWDKITEIAQEHPEDENALKLLKFVAKKQADEDFVANKYKDAANHILSALEYDDDDANLLAQIGAYYYSDKDYDASENYLQKALDFGIVNAEVHLLLAYIYYYHSDDIQQAIDHCEAGLEISPNNLTLKDFLEKLEKEFKVEGDFKSSNSDHFIVKYAGVEDTSAAYTVLQVLESAWSDIGYDLGDYPSDPIVILLYTDKQFNTATGAPLWAGGLFDGRIKIPVAGLPDKTDYELRRLLYHEYTHAVIQRITNGNCPIWLNEGIAQLMQERSGAGADPWLKPETLTRGGNPPLRALSAPFVDLSASQAVKAYTLSYYAVQYMVDEYGLTGVGNVLEELGTGKNFEHALMEATGTEYVDFEKRLGRYLAEL